jgi:DNA-binding NarL/FixJ family response regulator
MTPFRIILADDHRLFREGIRRILEDVEGLQVVGEAKDGISLLKRLRTVEADLVILDISMPGMRGIEVTKEIRSQYPFVQVLILTMHRDLEYFQHSTAAGASGFLLKEDADEALVSAVKTIQEGKVYVSPLLREELAESFFRQTGSDEDKADPGLTTREREVLKLIAEGKTNQEVADLFSISVRTVQHHRANLMRKLRIHKTADLIRYAIRKGYTQA